jgi:hypothetical protein
MMGYIIGGLKQTWRYKRMLAIYYGINMITALVLIVPLHSAIKNFAGHSLAAAPGSLLGMDAVLEFLFYKKNIVSFLKPWMVIAAVFTGVLQLFLMGGVLSVFLRRRRYEAAFFWSRCAKHFSRLLQLLLWSLPVLMLLMSLPQLVESLQRLFYGKDPYQYITFWSNGLTAFLRLGSLIIYYLIFDYGALYIIRNDESRIYQGLKFSLIFNFTNFTRTSGLTFLIAGLGIAVFVIYYGLAALLAFDNIVAAILLILTQQLFMALRMVLKLTRYASQIGLLQQKRMRFDTSAKAMRKQTS